MMGAMAVHVRTCDGTTHTHPDEVARPRTEGQGTELAFPARGAARRAIDGRHLGRAEANRSVALRNSDEARGTGPAERGPRFPSAAAASRHRPA
jgi:hypothetical protein